MRLQIESRGYQAFVQHLEVYTACMACITACPEGAIEVIADPYFQVSEGLPNRGAQDRYVGANSARERPWSAGLGVLNLRCVNVSTSGAWVGVV